MNCRMRRVTPEDCALLFEWANDPVVRRNSFSSAKISWEEHTAWFEAMQKRTDCGQYIYLCEEEPVGQARITVSGRSGVQHLRGKPRHGARKAHSAAA